MRLSSSTKAKVAAALLTAATPMLGSFSASAKQMAAAASTGDRPNFTACDQIKDPAANARCYVTTEQASLKAREQAANVRIVAADNSLACAKFLLSKKGEGVKLDPTRLNRERGRV